MANDKKNIKSGNSKKEESILNGAKRIIMQRKQATAELKSGKREAAPVEGEERREEGREGNRKSGEGYIYTFLRKDWQEQLAC